MMLNRDTNKSHTVIALWGQDAVSTRGGCERFQAFKLIYPQWFRQHYQCLSFRVLYFSSSRTDKKG